MQNALDAGAFGDLDKFERVILSKLIHHRNPETLRCDPSMGRLALETDCSLRTVSGAIKRLREEPREPTGADPSRGGHGLIARRRRRFRGNQTSNLYWFTERFYERFERYQQEPHGSSYKVRPDGTACHQQMARDAIGSRHAVPSNETLSRQTTSSDPETLSSLPRLDLNSEGDEPGAQERAEDKPPLVVGSSPGEVRALEDFSTFAALFADAHRAKYGDTPRPEMPRGQRVELGRYVRNLAGRACAAAAEREHPAEPAQAFAALSADVIASWLDHPGGNGFLERACHPFPRLFEDLPRFGEEALSRWLGRLPERPPLPDLRDLLPSHSIGLDDSAEPLEGELDAWEALGELEDVEPFHAEPLEGELGAWEGRGELENTEELPGDPAELEAHGGAWGAPGEAMDGGAPLHELEGELGALAPPSRPAEPPRGARPEEPPRAAPPRRPLGVSTRARLPNPDPLAPDAPAEIAAAIADLRAALARRGGPPGARLTGRR